MNSKVIYSKKSLILGLIIWGSLLLPLLVMLSIRHWIGVLIMLPILAFIGSIWFGTKYTLIDNQYLKIQCGLISFDTVDVLKIIEIKKTNTLLSAPANSLDRIEITYNNHGGSVVISPIDEMELVKMLLEINPKIKTQIV